MDMIVLSMAALAALAPSSPPAPSSAFGAAPIHASALAVAPSTAQRSPGGATAVATVSVRIISDSARIGPGAPPLPDMTPRASTIAAADGSQVAALIYDFE